MKSIKTLAISFFLLNLFLKSFWITSIPAYLTHDEAYYATQAQSFLAGKSDITGRWKLLDFAPANPIYSELTGVTYAVGFLLFPNNAQLAIKVVPVFFGSVIPVLLALIMYRLFKDRLFFTVTAILATVNPWIFQFSRMSFDSLASVFFYLLGMTILLYARGLLIIAAAIPFTLGFFQYQGHKPLLVPLVLATCVYLYFSQEKKFVLKIQQITILRRYIPHILLLSIAVGVVTFYLIRLPTLLSSVRVSEMTIDTKTLYQEVYTDRRLTFANPFSKFFVNKPIGFLHLLTQRFFRAFDLQWLFAHGNDKVDTFAVTQFGFLYTVDIILIIIGGGGLWFNRRWRMQAGFLTAIVLIGVLPNVLKNEELWLTFRGSFMILGSLLYACVGAAIVYRQKRRSFRLGMLFAYMVMVIPFFFHYFMRYPLLSTKDIFFYNRVIASYIARQPTTHFSIYGNRELFESILTYNHMITPDTIKSLHTAYETNSYSLQNVSLASGCFDMQKSATNSSVVTIVDYRAGRCEKTASASAGPLNISSVVDSFSLYGIYNDTLCKEYEVRNFINITHNVFALESLSDQQFCESFFTR